MKVLDQAEGNGWAAWNGDSAEVLRGIPDNSVHFSVYSPPFASLYVYGPSERDAGNCRTHAEFFEHYSFILRELYRVIKPGRLTSVHCMLLPTSKTRDGFIGLSDFRGQVIKAHQDVGFVYHSEVCIWKNPVTAMQRTKAIGLLHKQLKKDSCMSRQGIPDYLCTFRKPGANDEPVSHTDETFPVKVWQQYASPVWMDIDPSETLNGRSARKDEDERHIAPLQTEVIRRALKLWSNPGDIVLTPFGGIGSEAYVALEEGRRAVLVELKRSYYQQAVANLRTVEPGAKGQQTSIFDVLGDGGGL